MQNYVKVCRTIAVITLTVTIIHHDICAKSLLEALSIVSLVDFLLVSPLAADVEENHTQQGMYVPRKV